MSPDGWAVDELPSELTQSEPEEEFAEPRTYYLGGGHAILEDLSTVMPLPAQLGQCAALD